MIGIYTEDNQKANNIALPECVCILRSWKVIELKRNGYEYITDNIVCVFKTREKQNY